MNAPSCVRTADWNDDEWSSWFLLLKQYWEKIWKFQAWMGIWSLTSAMPRCNEFIIWKVQSNHLTSGQVVFVVTLPAHWSLWNYIWNNVALICFQINGVQVVKSGTDFRELSCITVSFTSDNKFCLDVQRIEITSDIPEDPTVKLTVDKFVGELFYCNK